MSAHPLGNEVNMSDAEWGAMDKDLAVLAQDSNGDNTYNNERAMVGYLESKYNLVVDKETDDHYNDSNTIKVDLVKFGKTGGVNDYLGTAKVKQDHKAVYGYLSRFNSNESRRKLWITKIAALNYVAMREAGMESIAAFVVAGLRARWVATGAYGVLKMDTAATYNEVTVADSSDRMYGRIADAADSRTLICSMGKYAKSFVDEYNSEKHGMRWVVEHAENFWAAVEHCFRVRNHHMKTEEQFVQSYIDLYYRFCKAAYEGEFEMPQGVEYIDIFRTAIHPFKIKALPTMLAHFLAYEKIANAAIIRTSGSPVGNAQITTTAAALDTMSSEIWWNSFSTVYKLPIELVRSFSAQINDNKYGFHLSAGLYGLTKVNTLRHKEVDYTLDQAKSTTSLVASACQGLIDALLAATEANVISSFALANAMALKKSADSNPLLRLRIKGLVEFAVDSVSEADSMNNAIRSALPQNLIQAAEEAGDE